MLRKSSDVPSGTHVKLTRFALTPPAIVVECDESVTWTIGKNDSHYSSIYRPGERYFILLINELGIESEQLCEGDSFEHKFASPGSYTISCLNYPGIKQRVKVTMPWRHSNQRHMFSESRGATDETSDNLRSPRDSSEKDLELAPIDEKPKDCLDDIGKCLQMFIKGCPEDEIRDNFKHLFVNKKLIFGSENAEEDEEPQEPEKPNLAESKTEQSRLPLKRCFYERDVQSSCRQETAKRGRRAKSEKA